MRLCARPALLPGWSKENIVESRSPKTVVTNTNALSVVTNQSTDHTSGANLWSGACTFGERCGSFVPLGKGGTPRLLRQGVARLPQNSYGPPSKGGQRFQTFSATGSHKTRLNIT